MTDDRTDKEFLESMAKHDDLLDHEDGCGQCHHQRIWAEVARELLAKDGSTIAEWSEETKRRWQEGKYYKLYQEEVAAGRDPHAAFEARGWEM